MKMSMKTTRQ